MSALLRWTEVAAGGLPGGVRKLVRDAGTAVAAVQRGLAKHLPRAKKSEAKAEKVKASRHTTS